MRKYDCYWIMRFRRKGRCGFAGGTASISAAG
jgi:hypothetical protein